MTVNELAGKLGDACYGFLTLNFLFGMYCVIVCWRRIGQLRFRSIEAEQTFVGDMQAYLQAGDYESAENYCKFDFHALPRLCLLMLANRDLGFQQLRQLVAENMQRDILGDLEHRLSWIVTVIKSGPLLGLFGTVLGMMAAFGRIGTGEKVQPHMIAAEISVALICTAMGLMTAIPLNYILSVLSIRVRLLQESLGTSLSRVLENFRSESSRSDAA